MSNNPEAWELDAAWFKTNFPFVATETEIDDFCDLVCAKMQDGMSESRARFESAAELRKRRHAPA